MHMQYVETQDLASLPFILLIDMGLSSRLGRDRSRPIPTDLHIPLQDTLNNFPIT